MVVATMDGYFAVSWCSVPPPPAYVVIVDFHDGCLPSAVWLVMVSVRDLLCVTRLVEVLPSQGSVLNCLLPFLYLYTMNTTGAKPSAL
jgi:hypothetical protein